VYLYNNVISTIGLLFFVCVLGIGVNNNS